MIDNMINEMITPITPAMIASVSGIVIAALTAFICLSVRSSEAQKYLNASALCSVTYFTGSLWYACTGDMLNFYFSNRLIYMSNLLLAMFFSLSLVELCNIRVGRNIRLISLMTAAAFLMPVFFWERGGWFTDITMTEDTRYPGGCVFSYSHGPMYYIVNTMIISLMCIFALWFLIRIRNRKGRLSRIYRSLAILVLTIPVMMLLARLGILSAEIYNHVTIIMVNLLIIVLQIDHEIMTTIPAAKERAVESTEDGVIILSRTNEFLYANPAVKKAFPELEWDDPDKMSIYIRDHFNPDQTPTISRDDHIFEIKKESVRTEEPDNPKSTEGYILWLIDVTARENYIKSLTASREESERAKEEADKANLAKTLFLSRMSHEIRTPMNAVLGLDEMILRESRDPAITSYAKDIKSSGRNLLSIINDILDFSKIESGKMEIVEAEYDLAEMINDVVNICSVKAQNKGLKLTVDVDGSLPARLYGDDVRIRQVALNLLDNAVKYTGSGEVRFRVDLYGSAFENKMCVICIRVEDTGVGIREDDIPEMFDNFRRLDLNKNRSTEGTGLGLPITYSLIKLMGGRLTVESDYGKGSVFSAIIPQQVIDENICVDFSDRMRHHSADQESYCESFTAPGARILTVDDDRINLTVFKAFLKRTGIRIDTAMNGIDALALSRNSHYDIIFLDHMMPAPDGIETLHNIRNDKGNPNCDTPIVVLTANAVTGMREMYMKEGFSEYISKPINASLLEEMIIKLLPESYIRSAVPRSSPFLDKEAALESCDGDEGLLQTLAEVYIEEGNDYLVKLKQAIEDNDFETYRIIVHSLKNTSLNVGATAFSVLSKAQEDLAKEENTDAILSSCDEYLKQFESILSEVKKTYPQS